MNTTSRIHLSPVHPLRSARAANPGGDRLLLGLTARNVRRKTIGVAPVAYPARKLSGLRGVATVLDRLTAPLTRHHD